MNTATCNWTTMRVIDYFWLLLLPLLCLTNQAQALSCNSIVDGSSLEKFESCTLDTDPFFGHFNKFVRLDFSTAKGDQITNFFGRATTEAKLSAAFRLVDNNEIVKVDFGNIKTWKVEDMKDGELFIEIANNINLEEFLFGKVTRIDWVPPIKVAIYNNPMLVWNEHEKKIIAEKKTDDSFFETELNACTFQNPLEKTKAIAQTVELTEKCQIFKGDLNLEGSALKDEITFKDGCLRLVNVDMTKITNITAENGQEQCTVDGVTPEIKNNPGLCGDKMATVAEYAPKAAIQLHKTCTILCKDQATVDHKFYRCSKIDADGISLNQWFTSEHSNIGGQLTEAKGISVKAGGPKVTKISMPVLKSVDKLEITDNSDLKILDFPSLENVKVLTIKNNVQLTLDGIRKMPKNITVGQAEVECNTHEYLVIADIDQLRYCTKIIGPLILRHVKKDVDPAKFNITEIVGCVQIDKTKLSNLEFLDKAKITCNGKHTLTDNKELCKPRFLGREKGAEITANGLKTTGCGKICTSLSEKNCVVFNGDLTVNDKTRPADIALLEEINGTLTITGAGPSLEFPVLTTINSSEAPGLLVSNNPNLASLKMLKLEKINPNGPMPKVKIENSPKLTDLKQFLPTELADSCSQPSSTTCQYDKAQKKEESDNIGLIAGLSAGGFLLLVLIAVGLAIWCCLRKKKRKMKKAQAEAEAQAKKTEAEPAAKAKKGEPEPTAKAKKAEAEPAAKAKKAEAVPAAAQKKVEAKANVQNPAKIKEEAPAAASAEKKEKSSEVESSQASYIIVPVFLVIKYRHPPTFKVARLIDMLDAITKLPHGILQIRILLRGQIHTSKDVEDGIITQKELDMYNGINDEKNKFKTNGIGLNRPAFLASEKHQSNFLKFMTALLESGKDLGETRVDGVDYKVTALVHIGPGFVEAMKYNKNITLTLWYDENDREYMKICKHFPDYLKVAAYIMHYDDGKVTHTRVIELMEMIVPEEAIGSLDIQHRCPWISVLYCAWQLNIVVHTSVPDYLVCSHYIYTGIDLLTGRIRLENSNDMKWFIISAMYPAYNELFAGKDQKDFNPITAFTIFITCMLEYLIEYMADDEIGATAQEAIKQLIQADRIFSQRLADKPTENMSPVAVEVIDMELDKSGKQDPAEKEKRQADRKYYERYGDKALTCLQMPAKELEYSKMLKFNGKIDGLLKESETTPGLTEAAKKKEMSKKEDDRKHAKEEKKGTSKEGEDEKKVEKEKTEGK